MEQFEARRIAPHRRTPVRRRPAVLLLLAGMALALAPIGHRASAVESAPGPIETYLKLHAQAEEATGTPEGPERIRKCEQFLKDHPDYPNLQEILWPIVNDSVKTAGFDPDRVADLLEKMAALKVRDQPAVDPAWVVPEYHLRYKLPLDRAERMLRIGREQIDHDRRELRRKPASQRQPGDDDELEWRESGLNLAEARVRLARGDAAGALAMLDADDRRRPARESGMVLRFRRDGTLRSLPTDRNDWRNLTRAGAYAAIGNRAKAREHFERVLMLEEAGPDLKEAADRLRADLGLPPPAPLQFRTDPRPAPELALKDLGGKTARLADFRGRVVLLVFWTTW